MIGKLIGKTPQSSAALPASVPIKRAIRGPVLQPLVLLGSSTGGPFALAEILSRITTPRKATIVIVQHVDAAFAPGLSEWLSQHAGRKVELIRDGMELTEGSVLLSGTDDHLVLEANHRLHYSLEPRGVTYRPSVDVFFKSVAAHWPQTGIAVLLTGMGRDGAEGLLQLRHLGWTTIAQDEATSVVWGMPRAAVELGAADQILPLPLIGRAITGYLSSQIPSQAQTRPTPF